MTIHKFQQTHIIHKFQQMHIHFFVVSAIGSIVALIAIFVFYPGPSGAQFLMQYAQQGLKGQIPLYTAFTIDELSLPLQKDLALGVPGAQQWVNDLPFDANKKFVSGFRAKYNSDPDQFAAQAYDTLFIVAKAINDAGAADAEKIKDALGKVKHEGVLGPFAFTPDRNPAETSGVVVLEMKNGKFGELKAPA